jgi:hypothetical protein
VHTGESERMDHSQMTTAILAQTTQSQPRIVCRSVHQVMMQLEIAMMTIAEAKIKRNAS